MLMRAWRLRVAPAFSAAAAAPRRSLSGSSTPRELSSSSNDDPLTPPTGTEKRRQETAQERKPRQAREFPLLPQLFKIYKQASGHYIVPYNFSIPPSNAIVESDGETTKQMRGETHNVCGLVSRVDDIPWPEQAKGMNFGRSVDTFWRSHKHQSGHPDVTRELIEMGVLRSGETHRQLEWRKQIMPALRVYRDIYGDSIVRIGFIVPRGDVAWPVATSGMRLGRVVDQIRQLYIKQKLRAQELTDLHEVEFSFDVHETTWSEKVLPSLEVFARVYGHCRVPAEFVVPKTEPWPRKAWGLNLGQTVASIRSNEYYGKQVERDAIRLDAIKFVSDHYEHQWSDRTLPSLETFRAVFGHCAVPRAFIVPSEAPWPVDAWGLTLGAIVSCMRSHGSYNKQAERDADRLDAIKFVRDHSEYQWSDRILPSLLTFHGQYGHCTVPQLFVVPSEAPWPKEAWGLRLGETVGGIRFCGAFAEQVKRDADRLEAIEFSWGVSQDRWGKILLPAFETFYQIHGHCDVPRDFVVPSEDPWPTKTWDLKLGVAYNNIQYRGDYAEQRERDQSRLEAISFRKRN